MPIPIFPQDLSRIFGKAFLLWTVQSFFRGRGVVFRSASKGLLHFFVSKKVLFLLDRTGADEAGFLPLSNKSCWMRVCSRVRRQTSAGRKSGSAEAGKRGAAVTHPERERYCPAIPDAG